MHLMRPLTAATIAALALAGAGPRGVSADTSQTTVTPTTTSVAVSAGAGNQTDPHVSGTLVTYTSITGTSAEIRYHDLATGVDRAIPNAGHRDSLPDVSGSTIVFRRVYTDGSSLARPIMAFDARRRTGRPSSLRPT